MYGYRPSLNLSDDENYMDIVMLITRNSMLRQGSRGCILVQPNAAQRDRVAVDVDIIDNTTHQNVVQDANTSDDYSNYIFNRIIAAANNTHLYSSNESDIHAEINAIGQVAKRQHYTATDNDNGGIQSTFSTTLGATAYITMPPCKKCFAALYTCGIQRIVTRKPYHKHLIETASNVSIELVSLSKEQFDNQKERMNEFFLARVVNNDTNIMSNRRDILRRRKQRKDNERARKMMARERK